MAIIKKEEVGIELKTFKGEKIRNITRKKKSINEIASINVLQIKIKISQIFNHKLIKFCCSICLSFY